ncbi:uncharacterized protein LOC135367879 [Ornithodoros turicata]|uniref:uncharacterized protein LOC135367879 n=1 Tax=Ornithodoros turicata TaxID=34597 RepID=UPI00313929F4
MLLLPAQLVVATLVATLCSGSVCHDPPQSTFPVHSSTATSRTFQDRGGFAHTQILPSGPTYHRPTHIQRIVATEAHHPIIHATAHHPILHASPAQIVTVQKASPLLYSPYLTYTKSAYEAAYPATVTTYKQPALIPLTYKQPITTTKVIESRPHVSSHTYVPPAPTGHAIVTSYFNIPGSGFTKTSDYSGSFGNTGSSSFDKFVSQQTQAHDHAQGQYPSQSQDRMYGQQGRPQPSYQRTLFPEDNYASSRARVSYTPQNDIWSSDFRQSSSQVSSDLLASSTREDSRYRSSSVSQSSANGGEEQKSAESGRQNRSGGYKY